MVDVRNTDDVIDSRDVIARIEELEDERTALVEALNKAEEVAESSLAMVETYGDDPDEFTVLSTEADAAQAELSDARQALEQWDDNSNGDELKALKALADEAECSPDWTYGETLIRDDYFTEYAQQLCEDIGDIPRDLPHYIVIDWEATAENIQADYTSVEFDGVTYWVR